VARPKPAGWGTETGHLEESDTGTPLGGILSPLLANIALSVLDDHVMAPWQPDAEMGTTYRRHRRRQLGLPTWRIVRYADDFVVLVHGARGDVEALHEDITHVLQPLGLWLSAARTRDRAMSDGFDFLASTSGGNCWCGSRSLGVLPIYIYIYVGD
jgi:RNA-directed DNA polymerase